MRSLEDRWIADTTGEERAGPRTWTLGRMVEGVWTAVATSRHRWWRDAPARPSATRSYARLRFREGHAVPQHIAIIMDGNGRWATQRHLPRSLGHRAGVEALRRVVRLCDDYHVPMLTVYAFSTENWGRPQEEVDALMGLLWETIRSDVDRLHQNGVRLRHIGRLRRPLARRTCRAPFAHMEDPHARQYQA